MNCRYSVNGLNNWPSVYQICATCTQEITGK